MSMQRQKQPVYRETPWATTTTGLRVESALDPRIYKKGIEVNDAEMEALDVTGDAFHPEWNYTFRPRPRSVKRSC